MRLDLALVEPSSSELPLDPDELLGPSLGGDPSPSPGLGAFERLCPDQREGIVLSPFVWSRERLGPGVAFVFSRGLSL